MVIHSQPGDFRIDADLLVQPRLSRLVRDGEVIPLERKAIELLVVLSDHAGEVMSRQELLDRVWEGVLVTEDVLYRTVSLLRAALEENPSAPRRLRTIRKVGYQLVADIRPDEPTSAPPGASNAPENPSPASAPDQEPRSARKATQPNDAPLSLSERAPSPAAMRRHRRLGALILATAVLAAVRFAAELWPPNASAGAANRSGAGESTPARPLSLIDPVLREAESIRADDPSVPSIRRLHLAEALERMGRPVEARRLLTALLADPALPTEIRARALAADAGALLWLGDYRTAERKAREALAVAESTQPPPEPQVVARAETTLGTILSEAGSREGLAYLDSGLRRLRESHGNEAPETARALHLLALGHWHLDDLLEAELYARQALALAGRIEDLDPLFAPEAEELFAATIWKLGRRDEALAAMRSAYDHYSRVAADERSLIATRMLSNIGSSYLHVQQYAATLDFARRALAIADGVVPDDLPSKATALQVLAFAHWKLGDLDTAETIQLRNLAMRDRLVGDADPHYATALHNLALLRLERGDVESAERFARRALDIRQRTFGDDNLSTAYSLVALGRVALARSRPDLAADFFRQALGVRRHHLGESSPLVSETEGWLLRAVEADSTSVTAILESH